MNPNQANTKNPASLLAPVIVYTTPVTISMNPVPATFFPMSTAKSPWRTLSARSAPCWWYRVASAAPYRDERHVVPNDRADELQDDRRHDQTRPSPDVRSALAALRANGTVKAIRNGATRMPPHTSNDVFDIDQANDDEVHRAQRRPDRPSWPMDRASA